MTPKRPQLLIDVFGERQQLCMESLHEIVVILDTAQRAKKCVILNEDQADRIRELVDELLVELE